MPSLFRQINRARPAARLFIYTCGMLAVGVVAGAAWSIHQVLTFHQGPPLFPEEVAEEKSAAEEVPREIAHFTYGYDLRNISIPLANRTASQMAYAQFTLKLDCPSADAKRDMEINRAKILDKVFEVATGFYIEDFKNPQGYRRFKDALTASLGSEFKQHGPRAIAIEEWVVE